VTLFRTVLRWVRALTSSRDNRTPDVIRIGSILIGAQFLALAAWDVVLNENPFDPSNYGAGAAAILAATGGALWAKRKDEPEASE